MRRVTLVTRETKAKRTEILQLSDLSSELLKLCDGERTVGQITVEFASLEEQVGGVPAEKACLLGLHLLRQQGLIVASSHPRQ